MIQSLCESCAWMRIVTTPRGSRFFLCELSATKATYPKYPAQPVVRCNGYEPMGAAGTHAPGDSPRALT